jgi:hypothetical protein
MGPIEERPLPSGDDNLTDEEEALRQRYMIQTFFDLLSSLYRRRALKLHTATISKAASSSKATEHKLLPQPQPVKIDEKLAQDPALSVPETGVVLNSFEAALAKKGITLEKAFEKPSTGSVSKEQYLADLNFYHIS